MDRLDLYEKRSSPVLSAFALVYLVLYGVPIVWPGLPSSLDRVFTVASGVLWVVFVADLLVRIALSGRPGRYLVTHPVDIALVVLPMLRPLRVLRIFTAAQYLLTRGGLLRNGQVIAAAAGLLVLVGALAVLDAERGAPGAEITTVGDALWWAVATVTSVGYGDEYPVTLTGRFVGAALMFVGIALVGTITATVAAWLVAHHRAGADPSEDVAQLLREVRALREEVARQEQQRRPVTA